MDNQTLQSWQVLHRRHVMGEILNAAEQNAYDAGCHELDATEQLDGNLERIRELRAAIAFTETEPQRLKEKETELDVRIVALEKRLDDKTRQLLGIGS